jgi:hypothetical protein
MLILARADEAIEQGAALLRLLAVADITQASD